MKAAIQEILQLRGGMSQLNEMVANVQNQIVVQAPITQSLRDPYNRLSYSTQDLERAFDIMIVRQLCRAHTMYYANR